MRQLTTSVTHFSDGFESSQHGLPRAFRGTKECSQGVLQNSGTTNVCDLVVSSADQPVADSDGQYSVVGIDLD